MDSSCVRNRPIHTLKALLMGKIGFFCMACDRPTAGHIHDQK